MIKLLPFILIPMLLIAGLGYWRYVSIKQSITPANLSQTIIPDQPLEVPKTLPAATVDDRVKSLEDTISKVVVQVNTIKAQPVVQSDSQLNDIQASITDLKARVSALEKSTPAQAAASSSQSVIYIPLGSGGSWTNTDWTTLSEYEVSLNPDNFPLYSGMILEVVFRLDDPSGTASVRLYNVSDSTAISSQIDTTSSTFASKSSSSFKLASGTKTYRLQVKSTGGKNLIVQTARIKVNF